jgi:hypothetical protein
MHKQLFIAAIVAGLFGCATQVGPVMDTSRMSQEDSQRFRVDLPQCQAIGRQASTNGAGMALLGALAGDYRRSRELEERERVVVSSCMRQRGHAVLY